jgi:Uncharacterised protein family (UPF0203)
MGSVQSGPIDTASGSQGNGSSVSPRVALSSTAPNENDVVNANSDVNDDLDHNNTISTTATDIKPYDPNRPKDGMPLVHYVCRKKKRAYDKCVSEWYSTDFLSGNGQTLNQEDICGTKFEVYRKCILKGIKKELWDKQNLPPPLEGSPLSEVMDDEDNNNHDDN